MEFHISRAIRDRLDLDDLLFSYTGNVVFGNVAASRRLAQKLTELRSAENRARGLHADPIAATAETVNAGALFAMGLIDELNHALVARYRREIDPSVLAEGVRWFAARLALLPAEPAPAEPEPAEPGPAASSQLDHLLLAFATHFPSVAVYRGLLTPAEWLQGSTDGLSNREAALEELLLLWIANINPAFRPFAELFDDSTLEQQTVYKAVTEAFPDFFSTRPPVAPEIGSLWEALRAPILASPDSLTGQLDFIRTHWTRHIGTDLKRVLLAIDTLREEDIAIWMRFHSPSPDHFRHGAPTWGSQGFIGDEFVGFDDDFDIIVTGPDGVRTRRKRYSADYQAPLVEYEAFSADQAWMPNVVLIAKSTYVWLEQLSKKYQRHIHRLDQIPQEELHLLARQGITGLWLIGLWERSTASRTIKRLRGHCDAVASAYSLKGYQIAADLGGNEGYEILKHQAALAGLRLASDMVPNHMGIDSDWVIEHPDWFIFRNETPFPVYTFEGPDLSTDPRVEIKIEDHYYTQTDAAVVFRLRHHADGRTRFVFHGNDGTTFAWNDTAQLDYSQALVREHVIQTILYVARLFPIIRFDAAMVLAKRHVQRLWFPLPGAGGSIPSRAENAMSQEEFDAIMPHEFWREVVDRVAVEVPGTLLLAEAFWLLEGYFVRTLGMHRVYNSAFMNMLRDEENAKYRSYLKKTIEFDPDILKRYVNFMSNPDERTAIDQFGDGDKYFGTATLLATLPGLPMFGHGQIEGFTERYGMEYKQAKLDESPNQHLVQRHQAEIAPLLKNRRIFAESDHFTLYDFWNEHGAVDENVFAYSNRLGDERSVILYNNAYQSTRGTIHLSAAAMDKGSGQLRQRSLSEGLALHAAPGLTVAYRDHASGLEYLRRASDLVDHGFHCDLRGYQRIVLLEWRELQSTTEQPWDRLADELNGTGVPSVEEAISTLRLRPLHQALHHALTFENCRLLAQLATTAMQPAPPDPPIDNADADAATADAATDSVTEASAPGLASESWDPPTALAESNQPTSAEPTPTEPTPAQSTERAPSPVAAILQAAAALTARAAEHLPTPEAAPTPNPAAPAPTLHADLAASTFLPAMQKTLMATWPAPARTLLPSVTAEDWQIVRDWAPILGWLLVKHVLPAEKPAETFDRLHLRRALAEIFGSLGINGEDRWRIAARIRLLVAHPEAIGSPTLWQDHDARWLLGVNESNGISYFNKEQFEEMAGWLQLPTLLAAAELKAVEEESIVAVPAALVTAAQFAAESGYQVARFLALWEARNTPPPAATTGIPIPIAPIAATPKPATPEPATPEPATPEPATPEPATPEPDPTTSEPSTPDAATPDPVTV